MLTFATGFPTLDFGHTIKSGNGRTGTLSESGFFGLLNSILQQSTPIAGTATPFSPEQRQALLSGARDQLGEQLKLAGIDEATLRAFYTAEPQTVQLTHLLEQIAGELLAASPLQQATQWLAEANDALIKASTAESNTLNPEQWRKWFLLMEKFSTSPEPNKAQGDDGEKGFAHLRKSLLLGAITQSVTAEKGVQKPEFNGAEVEGENLFALQQPLESLLEEDEGETETLAALRQIVQSLQEALREMIQLTENMGINPNDYPTAFGQIFHSIDAMKDQEKGLTEILTAVMESFSQSRGEGATAPFFSELPLSKTGNLIFDTLKQANSDLRHLLQNWQNAGVLNPNEALPQLAQSLASIQVGLSRAIAIPSADGGSMLQIVQRDSHALLFNSVAAVENVPQEKLFSHFKEQQPRRENGFSAAPQGSGGETEQSAGITFAVAESAESATSEINKAQAMAGTSTKTDPAPHGNKGAVPQTMSKELNSSAERSVTLTPTQASQWMQDESFPVKASDNEAKQSAEAKVVEPKIAPEQKPLLETKGATEAKAVIPTTTQIKIDLPSVSPLTEATDEAEDTLNIADAPKKDIPKESDPLSPRLQPKEAEKISVPPAPKSTEERDRIAHQVARIAAMEQSGSDPKPSTETQPTAVAPPSTQAITEKNSVAPVVNNGALAPNSKSEAAEATSIRLGGGNQQSQAQDQNNQDQAQQHSQTGREWVSRETVAPRAATTETPATPLTSRDIEHATEQIIRKVTMTTRGELKTLTVALKPEYMGKVNIRLSVEAGVLTARVMVENPSLRHGLEQTSGRIQEAISSLGLKVERLDIVQPFAESQSNQNGNQFANTQFHQGQENQQRKNRSLSSDQRGAPRTNEDEPQGGEKLYHYRTSQSLNLIA